ncbi:MAG: thymidine phosphorylase [Spirochaetes bacterium]|nr:MAG: thymidine phosphorylase [Spirochaetota bacterium]
MRVYDIIADKRDGNKNTQQQIDFLIKGYTESSIPDYQMAAWLMAAYIRGLDSDETFFLTKAMLSSGRVYDLSNIPGPKVDKHSTGGVGDKISIILAPVVAELGLYVPMTSGRGLGFTGGTLDKLESIPGFMVNLDEGEFKKILKNVGYVMSGQTEYLAPADRKMYALRDVTATIESIPLITSSILSKKFAEGAEAVVMDVKCGKGAFMKTVDEARSLAISLVRTGQKLGKKVSCIISRMDQPLGKACGNALEIKEAVSCLKGEGEKDLIELTVTLGSYMLILGGMAQSFEEGKEKVLKCLESGRGFERFLLSVEAQGGDVSAILKPELLPSASEIVEIKSESRGFINEIDAEKIGVACIYLKAGRFKKDDKIDYGAGVMLNKKVGDAIDRGEALAWIHCNDESYLVEAIRMVKEAFIIGEKRRALPELVMGTF